jgi:hypothetical protein
MFPPCGVWCDESYTMPNNINTNKRNNLIYAITQSVAQFSKVISISIVRFDFLK